MKTKYTTIRITHELWQYINSQRINPEDSPEEVIWRFIADDNQELKNSAKNDDSSKVTMPVSQGESGVSSSYSNTLKNDFKGGRIKENGMD